MELIFEFLFELLIEGGIEVAGNKKVSKWIRIPLIIIFSVGILFILGLGGFLGLSLIAENSVTSVCIGIFIIGLMIVLTIIGIRKIIKRKS
ncbi:MAG: hypothetical protein E7265_02690 [Lachnospiraceae bacterium]|nr:hypothetical protein [Lachnospiraceae bacterium]